MSNMQQQINLEINKVVKKLGNKIAKQTEQEVVKKVNDVIRFGQEQMIKVADEKMQEEFNEFYGVNYSSESLKQLYTVSINNLRPEISYMPDGMNSFKAKLDLESILDDLDDFIADAEESDSEDYYDEELYNEYYGDEDNVEDITDYLPSRKDKMRWKSEYYNKRFRGGAVPSPEEAFDKAKQKTIKYFDTVEMPKLKAYSKKVIGIDVF